VTCPAIVFLIFNRAAETFRVFDRIREARPEKLLIVADGPRPSRSGEAALCRETRAVVDRVDWPCEVLTNFAETNMGCGRRVASGLDWAFERVEEAIILEDNCLADPSFFSYCGELLERYRADERIMMISGDNFQNGNSCTSDSYYFSQIPHCWGWATWRRAWRHYDYEMHEWLRSPDLGLIKTRANTPALEQYWRTCFDDVAAGRIDTWDYQWMYCLWRQNGLSVAPDVNLVTNIGFGATATHTTAVDPRHQVPSREMKFPLLHPDVVRPCKKADAFENRYLHQFPRVRMSKILWKMVKQSVRWRTYGALAF
jgi:hypothetical protein